MPNEPNLTLNFQISKDIWFSIRTRFQPGEAHQTAVRSGVGELASFRLQLKRELKEIGSKQEAYSKSLASIEASYYRDRGTRSCWVVGAWDVRATLTCVESSRRLEQGLGWK